MGNCNSQRLVESLGDKCGSGGSATKRRRKRLTQMKDGKQQPATSLTSSSSSSSSTTLDQTNLANLDVKTTNANAMKSCLDDDKVKVIDLGSDLTTDETSSRLVGQQEQQQSNHSSKQESPPMPNETATTNRKPASEGEELNEQRNRLEKLKEGLDFIETEEDVKAVEAATLKIQSTFRGKKIRSKISTPKPKPEEPTSQTSSATSGQKQQEQRRVDQKQPRRSSKNNDELNKKLAEMQVQDNTNSSNQMDEKQAAAANTPGTGLPEEEAERAATKIQAGFKGYKTRKELEGKLPATSTLAGQQGTTAE